MSKYYRQTPKALDPQTLEKCNASILKLANDIGFLGFPQLNSDIVANCSCNPTKIAESIIAYRITNYFEKPNDRTRATRRRYRDWETQYH